MYCRKVSRWRLPEAKQTTKGVYRAIVASFRNLIQNRLAMPSTPSATAPMDVDFVIVAIVIADDGGRTRLGLSGGGLVQGEENRDRIEEGEGRMDLIGVGLRNRRIKLGEREREMVGNWDCDSFFLSSSRAGV